MEFWIAFIVTFIIYGLYKVGKRAGEKARNNNHTAPLKPSVKNNQKLTQSDEELITVILPTINHDN